MNYSIESKIGKREDKILSLSEELEKLYNSNSNALDIDWRELELSRIQEELETLYQFRTLQSIIESYE